MVDLVSHLKRQIAFSRGNFGPGERRGGIIAHIQKELVEVNKGDGDASEWVDVVILGLDGLTRRLISTGLCHDMAAETAVNMIVGKQGRNEQRQWPDWRGVPEDKPIEHTKEPWGVTGTVDGQTGGFRVFSDDGVRFGVVIDGGILADKLAAPPLVTESAVCNPLSVEQISLYRDWQDIKETSEVVDCLRQIEASAEEAHHHIAVLEGHAEPEGRRQSSSERMQRLAAEVTAVRWQISGLIARMKHPVKPPRAAPETTNEPEA